MGRPFQRSPRRSRGQGANRFAFSTSPTYEPLNQMTCIQCERGRAPSIPSLKNSAPHRGIRGPVRSREPQTQCRSWCESRNPLSAVHQTHPGASGDTWGRGVESWQSARRMRHGPPNACGIAGLLDGAEPEQHGTSRSRPAGSKFRVTCAEQRLGSIQGTFSFLEQSSGFLRHAEIASSLTFTKKRVVSFRHCSSEEKKRLMLTPCFKESSEITSLVHAISRE
jgi:hypothetical protein